jgi:membrane associated rhomboid family serine protease
MRPAAVGFQCPDEVKQAARERRAVRGPLGGRVARSGQPVVTSTLIGLNVTALIVMTLSGTGLANGSPSMLFMRLADIRGRLFVVQGNAIPVQLGGVAHGEWYRLLTSTFLHFGVLHLGLNMLALWVVGGPIERIVGRSRFLASYLLAGLGGSILSFLFAGPQTVSAGASGAVFGLFGGYFVLARRVSAPTGPIVGTIAINLVLSFSIPHIDYWGHIGGLLAGVAATTVIAYAPARRRSSWQGGGLVAVALVLVVLTAVGIVRVRSDERRHPGPYGVRIDALAPRSGSVPAELPQRGATVAVSSAPSQRS